MRRKCFARFLAAGANTIQELLLRYRVVSLDVIRTDTRSGADELADAPAGQQSLLNCPCKIDDCLTKPRCPLFQIIKRQRRFLSASSRTTGASLSF